MTSETTTRIWTDCPGIVYRTDQTNTLREMARTTGSGLELVHELAKLTQTNTNLATGKTLRFELNVMNKDVRIVDNGDGTWSAVFHSAGSIAIFADHRRVATDRAGLYEFVITFDDAGTPGDATDDVEIDFVTTKEAKRTTTEGCHFCDAMNRWTT